MPYGGGLWGGGLWGGSEGGSGLAPALTVLDTDPGSQSGRIAPSQVAPADGSSVFCLGHDANDHLRGALMPNDFVEVAQDDVVTDTMLTLSARTLGRAAPAGYSWKASVLVDDIEVASRAMPNGIVSWSSWAIDLRSQEIDGNPHRLAFRLTLNGPAPAGPYPYVRDVLIPAFYLDALTFETVHGPQILNLVPEDQQGITNGPAPADATSIEFDLWDIDGSIDQVSVTVNSVAAITNGVYQSGWTGAITGSGGALHVSLSPSTPFASSQVVNVVASCRGTITIHFSSHLTTVSRSWSFQVADTIAPVLSSAQAQSTKVVRATWSEAVQLLDPTDANDGLDPTRYTLTPEPPDDVTPAVTPNVIAVAIVANGSPSVVDLTTDIELSPGVPYRLTETLVADLAGNLGTSSVNFTAFVPPKPASRRWDLYSMFPAMNRREDVTRELKKFVACLQEVTDLLLWDIDSWTDILDVDRAPDAHLEAMLESLGNPFPFALSTTIEKRKLIRILVAIYKQKGTAPGLINAVRFFLGLTITIDEYVNDTMSLGESRLGVDWILGPGTSFALYSFTVNSGITLTDDQRAAIRTIANYMKPAHTHLLEIVEPTTPPTYDPVELGVSLLGVDWILH